MGCRMTNDKVGATFHPVQHPGEHCATCLEERAAGGGGDLIALGYCCCYAVPYRRWDFVDGTE